jgi:hypothetical protein
MLNIHVLKSHSDIRKRKNEFFVCLPKFVCKPKITQKKLEATYISTKLDKGFRLVYKLSYLVEEKIWSIFAHKGGPIP